MNQTAWSERRERGSGALLRLLSWLTLTLGWRLGDALLYPITAYFLLFSRGARGASRDYLARVLGRPASTAELFRHFFTFSSIVLDRVFFLSGRLAGYRIAVTGQEHVTAALAHGRGCVLLGAHLGSFELLRVLARDAPVPVNALIWRPHAGLFARLIPRLDPSGARRLIEIGRPESMLRVRECVLRGEIVGILADRAPAAQKSIAVPFLGAPARFPTGPFVLAATLDVPVVLFFGVRTGPRAYETMFVPLAERIVLERTGRAAALGAWIGRYARELEACCRAHPFNWFNFYDFW